MSSSCWKRRGTGPSKAKGRSRERETETQREGHREPERGAQRHRGSERGVDRETEKRGTEIQGRNSSGDQERPAEPQTRGSGAHCHQESQNKGPRHPLPQFPTTPIRRGAGQPGPLPSSPRPLPCAPQPLRRGLGSSSASSQ